MQMMVLNEAWWNSSRRWHLCAINMEVQSAITEATLVALAVTVDTASEVTPYDGKSWDMVQMSGVTSECAIM